MWTRLKASLKKTSDRLREGLGRFLKSETITKAQQEELEALLISADLGATVVEEMMAIIHRHSPDQVLSVLSDHLTSVLSPYEKKLTPSPIVLLAGVNGSGKTTTLGKLLWRWREHGPLRVIAADTFRAAAVEQLEAWSKEVHFTSGKGDPASVVFQGLSEAHEAGDRCVLIDTAGRLPNKVGLMDELAKIYRVIEKVRPGQCCQTLLVLDATLGQHALVQVEMFKKSLPLSGLILTKMEGTAKGGILVNIAKTYGLPIYSLGIGEKREDLEDFQARSFVESLLGL